MNLKLISKILPLQKHTQILTLSGNMSMTYLKSNITKLKKGIDDYKACLWPYKVIVIDFISNETFNKGFIETFDDLMKYIIKENGQTFILRKPKVSSASQKEYFSSILKLIKKTETTSVRIEDYQPSKDELTKELESKFKVKSEKRNDILIASFGLTGLGVGIYGQSLDKFALTTSTTTKEGKPFEVKGIETNVVQIMGVAMLTVALLRFSWVMIKQIIFRRKK